MRNAASSRADWGRRLNTTATRVTKGTSDSRVVKARLPATWAQRQPARPALAPNRSGHGRELFGLMRAAVGSAEEGACALFAEG